MRKEPKCTSVSSVRVPVLRRDNVFDNFRWNRLGEINALDSADA